MSDTIDTRARVVLLIKAGVPFIGIKTNERMRAVALLEEIPDILHIKMFCHSSTKGFFDLKSKSVIDSQTTIYGSFEFIKEQIKTGLTNQVFILTDAGDISSGDSENAKAIYELLLAVAEANSVLIVLTEDDVWQRIQQVGRIVVFDNPNDEESYDIIHGLISDYLNLPDFEIEWNEQDMRDAASTLSGLTKIEIENTICPLLAKKSVTKEDLYEIKKSKTNLFSNIEGLEKIEISPFDSEAVGLNALHKWCNDKEKLLSPEARKKLKYMGLRPPRGILLVGVPGCGKSLSAKTISARWKLPLYRLDFATVQGQYVGQSEAQLRNAFNTAESLSPCVLWIDEIEKGLAGNGSDSTGVSTRLVGQFLFWLQECKKMVFVVATANDVSKLPPELLRRGRFDENFFVDLPDAEERKVIISLYLKKYLEIEETENYMQELSEITDGFCGADIESSIRDLAYWKISERESDVPKDFIIKHLKEIVPLSKSNPEKIESIRAWGRNHAVSASGKKI